MNEITIKSDTNILDDKQIQQSQAWEDLEFHTINFIDLIRYGEQSLIRGYWGIGKIIAQAKEAGAFGYGDRFVELYSQKHKLHLTTLYQAIDVARAFPEWGFDDKGNVIKKRGSMAELKTQLERTGASWSWTSVRNRYRLLNAPDPATDPQQAEKVGGEDRQADEIIKQLERAHRNLEQYQNNGIPEGIREELSGTLAHIAPDLLLLAERLNPGLLANMSQGIEEQEQTQEVEVEIVDIYDRYNKLLLSCGCSFCPKDNRGPATHLRLWPSDRREAWQQVAICDTHEARIVKMEQEKQERWQLSLWNHNRENVITWFHEVAITALQRGLHEG